MLSRKLKVLQLPKAASLQIFNFSNMKLIRILQEQLQVITVQSKQYSVLDFYSCMKFRVSCIRVLAAIIVVYVFSVINKVFYFFVYVFSCTNNFFIISCMYFRVSIYIFIFHCILRVFFVYQRKSLFCIECNILFTVTQIQAKRFENKVDNQFYGPI